MTPSHPSQRRSLLRRRSRPGFLLIEMTLGMTLIVLFLGAFAITLIEGQLGGQSAGNRIRGIEQSQLALEAVLNMRDENFGLIRTGTHGTVINPLTGRWTFSGSKLLATGGYLTTLKISALQQELFFLRAQTSWVISPTRKSEVFLTGLVANWPKTRTVGDWGSLTLTGSYVDGGNPNFSGITVAGNYAYLTSDVSGRGFYVLDVSNPALPTHVSTAFTLGYAAYAVAARGSTVYILTSDTTAELKAYDVSTPATPVLVASRDLPDSPVGRALAVYGKYLIVGATTQGPVARAPSSDAGLLSRFLPRAEAATYCYSLTGGTISCASFSSSVSSAASSSSLPAEPPLPAGDDFLVFDVSDSSLIRLVGSLNASGVNSIAFAGTGAYLASDNTTGELRVVDMENPLTPAFVTGSVNGAPQGGYNLGSNLRGTAVAATATAALLGMQFQSGIQEFVTFAMPDGGLPPDSPAPLYYYASGSIVDVAVDPTACYGFIATKRKDDTLQVVKIRGGITQLTTYSIPPPGNFGSTSLTYDPWRDLLYLVNRKGVYILSPAAGPNDCS